MKVPEYPLLGLQSPSETTPKIEPPSNRPETSSASTEIKGRDGSSREVRSPTASSQPWAAALWTSLPGLSACAFRFSQPLDAFIRPKPAGLVSCRSRSWGSPFRALFLSSRRKLSPTPLPSCRLDGLTWSKRCLPTPSQRLGFAPAMANSLMALASTPRLQGLAPLQESVTTGRRFRSAGARSSLGPSPLQGAHSRYNAVALTTCSPHEVS